MAGNTAKTENIDEDDQDRGIIRIFGGKAPKLRPGPLNTQHTTEYLPHKPGASSSGTETIDGKHHHHHHHHHHKHFNLNPHVIHRTTSESLRLGPDFNASTGSNSNISNSSSSGTNSSSSNQPILLNTPSIQKKPKTSSFQITSVTVGNKLSADNGEDSADDLDESHTDDNSRITDIENETPSVSEDTFSKEDVFFSTNALGTAPVIPTSSQYGLVIVDPELGGVGGSGGQNISNVHVSVTDAGINIVGSSGGKLNDGDQKDLQHRNERFKVVKIESTEPFKRGRWMCMDYLDHTTLQNSENPPASSGTASTTQTGVTTNDSGVVVTENHIDSGAEPPDSNNQYNAAMAAASVNASSSPGQTLQHTTSTSAGEQQSQNSQSVNSMQSAVHAQTMSHIPNAVSASVQQQNIGAQSLPQAQIQQAITSQPQQIVQSSQAPPEFQQAGNSHIPGQSQPAQFYINNQPQQTAPAHLHGATLPSNINMQNGIPTNFMSHAQSQPQQQPTQPQSLATVNVPMSAASSVVEHASINAAKTIPIAVVPPQGTINAQNMNIQQNASMPPQSAPQSQISVDRFVPQSVAQSYAGPPVSVTSMTNTSVASGILHDIQHADATTMPQQQTAGIVSPASASVGVISQPIQTDVLIQQGQQPQLSQTVTNLIQENASLSTLPEGAAAVTALSAQQPGQAVSATSLQTQQSVTVTEDGQQAPVETDNESASGTSAVAIDNKIEQAMDLVKSHLMIAVREEVEVLKEKIAELMDRINQLELENTILKANVSQETLSQLSATMQTAAAKPPQNTNTSNGPVS